MNQARKIQTAPSAAKPPATLPPRDKAIDALANADSERARLRNEHRGTDGLDPAWREIANELASALRPYTLFGDMVVRDGRIVVETRVPGATLTAARAALDRLAAQVARESYRQVGLADHWNEPAGNGDDHAAQAA